MQMAVKDFGYSFHRGYFSRGAQFFEAVQEE
jgi:hypothetical protein